MAERGYEFYLRLLNIVTRERKNSIFTACDEDMIF